MPVTRSRYFALRGGWRFFWTTEPDEGHFVSGVCDEMWNVLGRTVEVHRLRREAKSRALALRTGCELGRRGSDE